MKFLLYFIAFAVFLVGPCFLTPLAVLAAAAAFAGKSDEPPPRKPRAIGVVLDFLVMVLSGFVPFFLFGKVVRYFDGPLSILMFLIPLAAAIVFNDSQRIAAATDKGREIRATCGEILGVVLAILSLGNMPFV